MKNLTIFLLGFLLITLLSAFQNDTKEAKPAAAVLNSQNSERSEAGINVLTENDINVIETATGYDLTTVKIAEIQNTGDLKQSLIAAVGSFLTMIIMILIKTFFPQINEKLKKQKD
jgi:hypothetical protein